MFKFVQCGILSLDELRAEHSTFIALCNNFGEDSSVRNFYNQHKCTIPTFFRLYLILQLIQPATANCERAFSMLASMISDQQRKMLQDYFQTQIMLRYNSAQEKNATKVIEKETVFEKQSEENVVDNLLEI